MEKKMISHSCTTLLFTTVNILFHVLSLHFYFLYFMFQMPYLT